MILAAIIEEKNPQEKILPVERGFERSRVSEDILASTYEHVFPIVQEPIAFTQEPLGSRPESLDHERQKRRTV